MGKRWKKYAVGQYRLGTLREEKGDRAVVVWRDAEGPHRRRLDAYTEADGRIALDRFVGRIEVLKDRTQITVGQLFDAYVMDREKDGKLIATFKDNWKALAPRFSKMQLGHITADVCRDYATHRFEQGRSAGTVWTELTRLRSCLNWAQKRRLIDVAPYVWCPQKPPPKQRVLTQEEIWDLMDGAIVPHVKLFIGLAIATGGRSEAIISLTWDRVDFDAATIDLREKIVENPLTKKVRKGRAIVPMTDEIRAMLQTAAAGRQSDFVIEWDGEPIKKIRKGFTEAVKRAGLGTDVTPHTLRHTVASLAADADVPMLKISRFLGHRDAATTERIYSKTRPEFVQDVANVIRIRRAGDATERR